MKLEYPFAGFAATASLIEATKNLGGQSTVDRLAEVSGVSSQSGSFKYRVLAARLYGLLRRQQETLTLTELGSRFCSGPDVSVYREVIGRVPAFADLGIAPDLSRDQIQTALLSSGVPAKRADRVAGIYSEILSRVAALPIESLPAGEAPNESEFGAAPETRTSPAIRPAQTAARGSLLKHPALVSILSLPPEGGLGWSESRRENFILGVSAVLRELLWSTDS